MDSRRWTVLCALAFGASLCAQTPAPPASPATAAADQDAAARQQAAQQRLLIDWPGLLRYREDNAKLGSPAANESRVVFIGDSITDAWGRRPGTSFFPGKPYVNRGISGQTTPQMLVRFRPDVLALKPKVVVILAGINDIAENTGPTTLQAIEDNLMSMIDLALANRVRVVLATVTPAIDFPWRRGLNPAPKITALNTWITQYAAAQGIVFLDYHSALVDETGGMRVGLSTDGVHPNEAGYSIMAPLAEKAIADALRRSVK
jgi:lysophospholipase L1-like esterase